MKTAAAFLLCVAVFGQAPATVASAPALDKTKLEAYLRHLEVWPPMINVKIDDPKPATDLPGYNKVMVHLTYNDAHMDQGYFVSPDGQTVIKGDVYNLNKNPFQANLDTIKTDHQPSFGAPEGASVTLVIFGDFECPYCKEEATTLRQNLPSTFPGKVRVYFMDYPLESIHPWSREAAVAGRCAYQQGEDAFWNYHDWIYAHQQEITKDNYSSKLTEWASQAGIDAVKLGRCADSKATDAEVTRTQKMGNDVGVDGATPTLYLNGRKLQDQYAQWTTLQQLISMEIDHQAKVKEEENKCCVVEVPQILKK